MGARGSAAGFRVASLTPPRRAAFLLPAVLAAAVLLGTAARPARAAEGEPPQISAIDFEGNRSVSDGTLRSVMRLREPSWLRPFRRPRYLGQDYLASDLRSVLAKYHQEGYPFARIQQATVTHAPREESVRIVIAVEEGPRVRFSELRLRGLGERWEHEAREASGFRRGEFLSLGEITRERDKVTELLSDRGHPLGRTEVTVQFERDSADVVFDVEPGPPVFVDSIRIEGLHRTRAEVVRREISVRPGGVLLGRRVLESRQRLLDTGIFTRVRLVPQFADSSRPEADLRVTVEERKSAWIGAGGGYSSLDRLRFNAEWGLRSIAGTGRRLGVTGDLYYSLDPDFRGGGFNFREGQAQLDYQEPWILRTRTRLFLTPYIRWNQEVDYHQRTLGYNVTLRRELNRWSRVSLGVQSKHVRTTEENVRPRYITRLLNLDYTLDRRDNLFDPKSGQYAQTIAEYAGGLLAGTNRFARFTASWQGYAQPQRSWVVAARVKVGGIEPIGRGPVVAQASDTLRLSRIPSEERFRLGGGNTIRGYREGMVGRLAFGEGGAAKALGGLSMLLVSLELRFPIVSIVNGGMFLDAGNVWADPKEIKLRRFADGLRRQDFDPRNVAYGMGVGLRVATPVGPFRFDYGVKIGSGRAPGEPPSEIHVALGQAF